MNDFNFLENSQSYLIILLLHVCQQSHWCMHCWCHWHHEEFLPVWTTPVIDSFIGLKSFSGVNDTTEEFLTDVTAKGEACPHRCQLCPTGESRTWLICQVCSCAQCAMQKKLMYCGALPCLAHVESCGAETCLPPPRALIHLHPVHYRFSLLAAFKRDGPA
jgi:hypothetical protein